MTTFAQWLEVRIGATNWAYLAAKIRKDSRNLPKGAVGYVFRTRILPHGVEVTPSITNDPEVAGNSVVVNSWSDFVKAKHDGRIILPRDDNWQTNTPTYLLGYA